MRKIIKTKYFSGKPFNDLYGLYRRETAGSFLPLPDINFPEVPHKQDEPALPATDIPILFKIGNNFIPKGKINSIARFGNGCKITLTNGDEFLVGVNYTKVAELIK